MSFWLQWHSPFAVISGDLPAISLCAMLMLCYSGFLTITDTIKSDALKDVTRPLCSRFEKILLHQPMLLGINHIPFIILLLFSLYQFQVVLLSSTLCHEVCNYLLTLIFCHAIKYSFLEFQDQIKSDIKNLESLTASTFKTLENKSCKYLI